ncbi:MAG: membrane protein insertion efficiency factor YidD [Lentisphaerota bacterium]
MRKEVQQKSRNQKSCPETSVGVVPDAEDKCKSRSSGDDSQAENDGVKAAGSSGTDAVSVKKVRSFTGVVKSFRLTWIAIGAIKIYQWTISPLLPRCCRFTPSCSQYAIEAFKLHGMLKGSALTVWRLLRCQPFGKGGFDPVPPRRTAGKN